MTPRRQRRLVEPSSNRQESHRNSCREVKRSFFSLTSSTSGLGKPKAGRPHLGISTPEFPCGGSDHEHHRRQDASPTTATAFAASIFAGSTLPDLRRRPHCSHVLIRRCQSIPARPGSALQCHPQPPSKVYEIFPQRQPLHSHGAHLRPRS